MKKLILHTSAVIFGSICLFTACKKDDSIPKPAVPVTVTTVPDNSVYYRQISNWSINSNAGEYTNDMGTFDAPKNTSSPQVKVYMLQGSVEIPINQPFNIRNGKLWAIINGLDVSVVFKDETGTGMPFTSLSIKIEIK